MIQNINLPFDNQYKNTIPTDEDFVICIENDNILLNISNGKITFPTVSETQITGHYLFNLGGKNFFSGELQEDGIYSFYSIRSLRQLKDKPNVFAAITAYHICSWYTSAQYCGKCGSLMTHSKTERAMVCSCGNTVYPRINPAVIVGIISNDRICLTKYNRGYAHWALVAGYSEAGESVEETVRREVMEETGLKIKNLRFYKSQPWGLSSSLLFGFFCETDGTDTIKVDSVELKEGKWFSREEIDFYNDDFSLTREMIDVFRKGLL